MAKSKEDSFFIGWANSLPKNLWGFIFFASAIFIGAMAGFAFTVSANVDDAGNGQFAGRTKVVGIMETNPYPLLRVPPEGNEGKPRVVLLSGRGKRGVQEIAEENKNELVEVSGTLLKRGKIDMIQVANRGVKEPEVEDQIEYVPSYPKEMGKWRLVGEICDGKCYQGAMRPGTGLSHKACANLCLIGGIPPVFVSSSPIEGNEFFLLADLNGNPLSDEYFHLVAVLIEVEGFVEERDDLMVFKIDLNSAEVL